MQPVDKGLIDSRVEPTEDKIYNLIKTALSSVPVIGGGANELFQALITSPIEKRREEWMLQVTDALKYLHDNQVDLKILFENDELFFSTFIQASEVAIKTHQEEKRTALRNAIVNSALYSDVEDYYQQTFIQLVDRYTVLHLRAIQTFSTNIRDSEEVIYLGDDSQIASHIINDLQRDNMLEAPDLLRTYEQSKLGVDVPYEKRTSALADKFLKFISSS